MVFISTLPPPSCMVEVVSSRLSLRRTGVLESGREQFIGGVDYV